MSSKEASWVEMVPQRVSWEVCPRGDPHLEEEEVVAVEPRLVVEAEAEVAADHSKAPCGLGLPVEEEEEVGEADS